MLLINLLFIIIIIIDATTLVKMRIIRVASTGIFFSRHDVRRV